KVMGLAAYGQPRYMDLMERMLQPTADGRFRMDQRYFAGLLQQSHEQLVDERGEIVIPSLYSPVLEEELGPPRVRGAEITQRDKDLAASCQKHFESVLLHCLRALHERVPVPDLVTAGGCALNGVANARILRDTPFRRMYTHCAAGDDGTAVGAALHVWHRILEGERIAPITHASFGPAHEECAIEEAVRGSGYAVQRLTPEAVLETVADELHRGRIVGWYQGRSEWGPRALGNRSILAHPGWPGMKDLLNSKIKRREAFRPFAPSILAERVPDYFEQDVHSPFMMHVVRIREEKRSELAAVTHEDSTGRLHSVTREQNPMYYDLISAFARRSGTPVVLNTSFNENEPIVDTPAQAVDCFVRTDMDVLCAGPFLLRKEGLS
ncbi:MAG TPA: carbamoyltransferase C-terminal domain-containing protein, partial [Longimicrobiales bacterium]